MKSETMTWSERALLWVIPAVMWFGTWTLPSQIPKNYFADILITNLVVLLTAITFVKLPEVVE